MKLYIAGSSQELDRAALWIARAKEAGIEITLDWTIPIREKGSGNTLPFVEKQHYACADRDAIRSADAFWFLVPARMSFGATWEFGFAYGYWCTNDLAQPDPIVLSGPKAGDHIFSTLAHVLFQRDEDAFEHLLRACVD